MSQCGALPAWEQHLILILVFAGYAIFEQWLGRTRLTTAASTLDLISAGVRKLFGLQNKQTLVVKSGEPPKES